MNKSRILFISLVICLSCCLPSYGASVPSNSLFSRMASSVWGKPSYSQFLFLPMGVHFEQDDDLNNHQWLIALNVHGFIAGTFLNSNNKRVGFGGVERQIFRTEHFSLDYLLGIMQGYQGVGLDRLPRVLRNDPGPLVALTGTWFFLPNMALNLATYGVGGLVGVSYLI